MRLLLAVIITGCLYAAPPVILGLDLESGPKTGGENGNGAYVTIYGKNFGATRGSSTVTLNGAAVAAYTRWGDTSYSGLQEKITVELGSAVSTGVFVVTVGGVASNNSGTFTVRSGTIYFVATTGNNSNAGTFASPWLTIPKAKNTMVAGDISYIRNGVAANTDDGSSSCLELNGQHGTLGNPLAIVGYPGATATIGKTTSPCELAIRSMGNNESFWTFANVRILAVSDGTAGFAVEHWRLIDVDVQCPNGNGMAGCVGIGGGDATSTSTNAKLLFSNVGPAGTTGASSTYHGIYWSLIQGAEIGWNHIHDVRGCRAVHFFSPGDPMGNISVHDNLIHDVVCDAILFADGSDPNIGQIAESDVPAGINIYQNVIYNSGTGDPPEGASGNFAISVQDWKSIGQSSGGTIQIYNNTMYANGTNPTAGRGGGCYAVTGGGSNPSFKGQFRNNICVITTTNTDGQYYWQDNPTGGNCGSGLSTNCGRVFGDKNIFFGMGAMWTDANMTNKTVVDPVFTNTATHDLTLQSSSTVKTGALTIAALTRDFNSLTRPQGASYAYGAYEIDAGGGGGGTRKSLTTGKIVISGKVAK